MQKHRSYSPAMKKKLLRYHSFLTVFLFVLFITFLINLPGSEEKEKIELANQQEVLGELKAKEDAERIAVVEVKTNEEDKSKPKEQHQTNLAYIDVSVATLWSEPDITRSIDEPAIGNPVDLWEWTGSMSLDQRNWLVGNLQTQALYGQTVTVLEEQGDWVMVAVHEQPTPKNDLGYVAWMPKIQMVVGNEYAQVKAQNSFAIITKPTAWLYHDEKLQEKHIEISYNTRLPVISQKGDVTLVATPSDGDVWISTEAISVYESEKDIPKPTEEDLVRTGEQFLSLPYLWAGTSGFGFDCSGFTYTIYKSHGITIPRDSTVQATHGVFIEKADLAKGDLLFFATNEGKGSVHHVGMYIGDGKMIHAPNNKSPIEIINVFESAYWSLEYVGARRYIDQKSPG